MCRIRKQQENIETRYLYLCEMCMRMQDKNSELYTYTYSIDYDYYRLSL